ncbi:MAG TPA: DUF3526 domain-containing protein [bacterium]|nr:DUF3526 domain-containing protein [bacterium]
MILSIALKEFYANLISARFTIGFLLCLFLLPFSLFVSISDYKSQVRAYEVDKKAAEESNNSIQVYSALRPELVKPPEPLSIFSRGIIGNVGSRIKIQLGEKPFMTTGKTLDRENPFLNSFFSLDFISILAIVMSLIAILFTYNTCSRDRELGTLKLMLSNPISRWKILMGKIIGVFLTLLPIILFCYILCAVLILLSTHISFSAAEWLRVVMLFAVSIIYILIFLLIGMFVSTRTRSSSTSIVLCLFAWVLFVFIIPNLSVYTAQSLIKTESQDNLRISMNELEEEFNQDWIEYSKRIGFNSGRGIGSSRGGFRDGHEELAGQSPEFMEGRRKLYMYSAPLRIDYADKKWALQKKQLDRLDFQRRLAEAISLISPSEMFRLIASALCRTDVKSHYLFLETVTKYRDSIISFFKDEKLFSSFVYFTRQDPDTFMPEEEYISTMTDGKAKTFDGLMALVTSTGFDMSTLINVEIPGDPFNKPPLDLSNVPQFHWLPLSIGGELRKISLKLTALILAGIVLFYLSFISFIRYDVR